MDPKQKQSLLKEWLSPVAIATYLGTIGTLAALWKDSFVISTVILALLSAVLLASNFLMYRRYSKYKRFTQIDEDLRRLTHTVKEYVLMLRLATSRPEMEEQTAGAIRAVLTSAAEIFTRVTTSQCTASIMMERDGLLRTESYCYQVNRERADRQSLALQPGEGIAGQAFSTGTVVVWGPSTQSFKAIRDDYSRFYQTGISIPIRTSMQYAGLLNIDSKTDGVFIKERQEEIAHVLADLVGLVMDCRSLWKDLNVDNTASSNKTAKQYNRRSHQRPREISGNKASNNDRA
jgi:transcriptional regulator with GAF, ATPase, and Fis domain